MSARMSSVAANFAVVLTKLIDPLSQPMLTDTFVPSSCSAFDSVVAVPRLRALAHHRRGEAADAAPVGGLELIGSAEEGDRERHERQVVLFGDDRARRRSRASLSSTSAREAPASCRCGGLLRTIEGLLRRTAAAG